MIEYVKNDIYEKKLVPIQNEVIEFYNSIKDLNNIQDKIKNYGDLIINAQ